MPEYLQYILLNVLIAGVVVFIFQTWVTYRFDRVLAEHEASVSHRFDKALAEHEAKHKVLEERRAEVIHQTYTRLARMRRTLRDYTSEWQVVVKEASAKKADKIAVAVNELAGYFDDNRLYFSDELGSSLEKFIHYVIRKSGEFSVLVVQADEDDKRARSRTEAWTTIHKEVNSDGEELLRKLRKEFQGLIGIE